jgi:hypothetical protein
MINFDAHPETDMLLDQGSFDDWEQFISDEIIRVLGLYQGAEIVMPGSDGAEVHVVAVHIPYMMQTLAIIDDPDAFERLAQRHQDRLLRVRANRDNAPQAVKQFLHEQFYDGDYERLVARGRAGVDDIQSLLQAAVEQGLVPAESDGYDLRTWLKHYGIGIDCSAFVQHALTQVVRTCYARMRAHSHGHPEYEVGWMRGVSVYSRLTTDPPGSRRFLNVPTPMDARPGDILIKKGHSRLVIRAYAVDDGSAVFDLAESTSARDIPKGREIEETDIGPRMIQVQYPEPKRPICEQSPVQKGPEKRFTPGSDESSYILGRLKILAWDAP